MAAKTPDILSLLRRTYPFQQFSPDLLDRFIGKLSVIEPNEKQALFQVGDDANAFFIVLDGRITVERMNQNNEYSTFAVIEEGEFFGLDSIKPRNHYRTRATAAQNTKVLSISMVDLMEIQHESVDLYRLLTTLHRSYQALVEMRLSWKEPDELVFLSIRKHPIFLWAKLIFPVLVFLLTFVGVILSALTVSENVLPGLILLFAALFFTGFPALYIYINWSNNFYMITDRKILSRQRDILLYETKNIIPYNAVQSVAKKIPGFWAAMLQYGDVELRTYSGVLTLKGVANPEIIISLIEDIRVRGSIIQKQYTREENIQEMRKRLGLEPPAAPKTQSEQGDLDALDIDEDDSFRFFNHLFQSLFQLRVAKGDEITYRKHWLILFKESNLFFLIWTLFSLYLVYSIFAYAFISLTPTPWQLTVGIGLAWLVISSILAYRFIDWRNDRYVLTNRVIMDLDKKPFGKENRRTAPLERIQAVEYNRQGFLRILFNYGTVFIRVGDQQFSFDEVANPFAVQQEITERLNQAKDRERQNEVKRERETILDWIEIYHTVAHKQAPDKEADEKPQDKGDDIIKF